MRKKIIILAICLGLFYFNFIFGIKKAEALWPTSAAIANLIPEELTSFAAMKDTAMKSIETIKKYSDQIAWAIAKTAALLGSQMAVSAILDTGNGGTPYVSDWNSYLYLSPQQRTMTYMNSLFTQTTRGRASTLNYEGIGQKNDQYLLRQVNMAINSRPLEVNLRDYATNPDNVFDSNNFRGFNAFLLPQNNPYGITMIAQNMYQSEMDKQKTLADKKQNNGFVSKEKNGRIIAPAALLQSGFLSLDQMGRTTIENSAEGQWENVAIGVSARIAGAFMQSAFGSDASKQSAIQQNAQAGRSGQAILQQQINTTAKAVSNNFK